MKHNRQLFTLDNEQYFCGVCVEKKKTLYYNNLTIFLQHIFNFIEKFVKFHEQIDKKIRETSLFFDADPSMLT